MAILLDSKRLLSGKFTLNDAQFIYDLLNTEGWTTYIGNRNLRTIEQAETFLLDGPLKKQENLLPQLCRISLKNDDTPAGLVSLIQRDDLEHADIGFAFLPERSGKGYAFEIVSEILRFAFKEYKFEKILAIVLPENLSSIRLLEKLGMTRDGTYFKKETNETLLKYSLSNYSHKIIL